MIGLPFNMRQTARQPAPRPSGFGAGIFQQAQQYAQDRPPGVGQDAGMGDDQDQAGAGPRGNVMPSGFGMAPAGATGMIEQARRRSPLTRAMAGLHKEQPSYMIGSPLVRAMMGG